MVTSGSAHIDPEQAAAVLPARSPFLAVLVRGAGDEQFSTHKLGAGDVGGRQDDSAHDLPGRGNLDDGAAVIQGVPDVAILINPEAVRVTLPLVLVMDALVGDAAVLGVVVKREDGVLRRVGEVHGLAIRGPAKAVGDGQTRLELLLGLSKVKSVKGPWIQTNAMSESTLLRGKENHVMTAQFSCLGVAVAVAVALCCCVVHRKSKRPAPSTVGSIDSTSASHRVSGMFHITPPDRDKVDCRIGPPGCHVGTRYWLTEQRRDFWIFFFSHSPSACGSSM